MMGYQEVLVVAFDPLHANRRLTPLWRRRTEPRVTRTETYLARLSREAEALRLNLLKRKQQQRSRAAPPPDRAPDPDPPPQAAKPCP